MSFDKVLGHDSVKQRLMTAVELGRVSHAYIFSGSKGIGKTTTALEFAAILTEQKKPSEQADVIYVTNEHYGIKDKAAVSVDTVRAARVDMFTKPYVADRKVFIFPNAETMTVGAQNALLKVFEEPPSYCVIILITQNENMLLPTIRSRAVTIKFAPLEDEYIRRYLVQKYAVSDDVIVRLCAGSIAKADSLVQEDGISELIGEFTALFRKFASHDMECVYQAIAVFEREKERFGVLLDLISAIAYDSAALTQPEGPLKIAGFNPAAALQVLEMVEEARRALQSNRNYNMVVSELLIQTWGLMHG
ncbi:MAG: AAA family ATPase [Eubacteriales bacterium]|jgi:DNA polymerase-3 subunit delta'|nr:AAA family ATPase [Eubacteriales bacterium]